MNEKQEVNAKALECSVMVHSALLRSSGLKQVEEGELLDLERLSRDIMILAIDFATFIDERRYT